MNTTQILNIENMEVILYKDCSLHNGYSELTIKIRDSLVLGIHALTESMRTDLEKLAEDD